MGKDKVGAVVAPIYAKVENRVLYVNGKVGDYTIAFKANIAAGWTASVTRISEKYALVYREAEIRLTPLFDWSKGKYLATQDKVVSFTRPILLKAKDGCTYVQVQIGDTIVYIRTAVASKLSDAYGRISNTSIAVYNKAYKSVSYYTGPVVEQVVAMYQKLKMKTLDTLQPLLVRANRGFVDAKVTISDVTARVRARLLAAKAGAVKYTSELYIKIKDGFIYVQGRFGEVLLSTKVRLEDVASIVKARALVVYAQAQSQILAMTSSAKTKAIAIDKRVRSSVSNKGNQVTAASAVGGAAALGASGGASGLFAGGAIGAACGVVPAIFTFGLSIPIGAALGGATGLCVGTVTGGAVGLVGGGVAGRSSYNHKDEIKSGVACALTKANGYKDIMAEKASGYKDYVAEKTGDVKARIISGTGGTA